MNTAMKGLFFSLLLVNMTAEANTLQYNEAVDGDLSSYAKHFILGIGVNTISGNLTISDNDSNNDFDYFDFSIPDGGQLTSFTFAFSNVISNDAETSFGPSFDIVDADTFSQVAPYEHITVINSTNYHNLAGADVSPVSLFVNSLPLGSGSYFMRPGASYLPTQNPGGSLDYTISMQVAAVPVPGAVWLFCSGLLGLLGFKKRKAV